jgi:hypothetical protein
VLIIFLGERGEANITSDCNSTAKLGVTIITIEAATARAVTGATGAAAGGAIIGVGAAAGAVIVATETIITGGLIAGSLGLAVYGADRYT